MKTFARLLKISAQLITLIALLSLLGWTIAINNLKTWCDRFVAISMLTTEPKPVAIAAIRTKGKAIAQKVISIKVKESRPNYAEMTVKQLRPICRELGIKGWNSLRKAAMIDALQAA